jgi:hypothetical protein
MWNEFILLGNLLTVLLALFLTGIMTAIGLANRNNVHIPDLEAVSKFQKFLSSFYNRLSRLEWVVIGAFCLCGFLSYNRTYSAISLFAAAGFLTIGRSIARKKLHPINKQVVSWTSNYIPGKWKYLRDKWFSTHLLRILFCVISLLLAFISLCLTACYFM